MHIHWTQLYVCPSKLGVFTLTLNSLNSIVHSFCCSNATMTRDALVTNLDMDTSVNLYSLTLTYLPLDYFSFLPSYACQSQFNLPTVLLLAFFIFSPWLFCCFNWCSCYTCSCQLQRVLKMSLIYWRLLLWCLNTPVVTCSTLIVHNAICSSDALMSAEIKYWNSQGEKTQQMVTADIGQHSK